MLKNDHYKKCDIRVLVNKAQKTVIFFYENGSRGRDVLTDFLGDVELKGIMSDGYNAYVFSTQRHHCIMAVMPLLRWLQLIIV